MDKKLLYKIRARLELFESLKRKRKVTDCNQRSKLREEIQNYSPKDERLLLDYIEKLEEENNELKKQVLNLRPLHDSLLDGPDYG